MFILSHSVGIYDLQWEVETLVMIVEKGIWKKKFQKRNTSKTSKGSKSKANKHIDKIHVTINKCIGIYIYICLSIQYNFATVYKDRKRTQISKTKKI